MCSKTKRIKLFFIAAFILFAAGCGEGIEPGLDPVTNPRLFGFAGTIDFIGDWPDSVMRTHIVVFRNPLLTAADFNPLNLAFVSDSIPYNTQSFRYFSTVNPMFPIALAGEYKYVAVVQSKAISLSLNREDWYVVGLYQAPPNSGTPAAINIPSAGIVDNINIVCDYNNPPPQPPGGEPR